MPCQVPSARRPSAIGSERAGPSTDALMCAGMSSGPSSVCVQYGASSGTAASNHDSKSRRTSGEAFSLSVSEAEVWSMKRCSSPTRSSPSSGSSPVTSRVTRWNPRPGGRSSIWRWSHTAPRLLGGRLGQRGGQRGLGRVDRGLEPAQQRLGGAELARLRDGLELGRDGLGAGRAELAARALERVRRARDALRVLLAQRVGDLLEAAAGVLLEQSGEVADELGVRLAAGLGGEPAQDAEIEVGGLAGLRLRRVV